MLLSSYPTPPAKSTCMHTHKEVTGLQWRAWNLSWPWCRKSIHTLHMVSFHVELAERMPKAPGCWRFCWGLLPFCQVEQTVEAERFAPGTNEQLNRWHGSEQEFSLNRRGALIHGLISLSSPDCSSPLPTLTLLPSLHNHHKSFSLQIFHLLSEPDECRGSC